MSSSEDEDDTRVPDIGHEDTGPPDDGVPVIPASQTNTWTPLKINSHCKLVDATIYEIGKAISNSGGSFEAYNRMTKNIASKINVRPIEIETYVSRKRKRSDRLCAVDISRSHPNLMQIYNLITNRECIIGILAERSFNTLEKVFLPLPLDQLPPLRKSLSYAQQLIRALNHLHNLRVIHGHLSPEWVHFDSGMRLKLLLAPRPFFNVDDRLSNYSAPELRNSQFPATAESDIYSAACLIFKAFHTKDPTEEMEGVSLRRDLPGHLRDVLERCWMDRGRRPDALQLLNQLHA